MRGTTMGGVGGLLVLLLWGMPARAQEATPEGGAEAGGEGGAEGADGAADEAAEIAEAEPEPEPVPPHIVEASDWLTRGISLYDAEDYAGALSEFQQAYDLVGEHPARFQILFNIARAHERLFRYDDAIEAYRRYLDEGGTDLENYATVQATLETLAGLLGTLTVSTNVDGAEIWVDDRLIGTAPGTIRVTGGRHTVELRAPDYAAQQQEVQVAARGEAALEFELAALADEYRGLSPAFFYGAVGATVVALGVGIGFGVGALGARSTVDDRTPSVATRDEVENIQSLSITADIFYVTAGVFAAAAIVLGIFTDWGGEEETRDEARLSIQPVFGPDAAGVVVRGAL